MRHGLAQRHRTQANPVPAPNQPVMHELPQRSFGEALPLFRGSSLTYGELVVAAMAEGNAPGRMWVDDAAAPSFAFAWDERSCSYLVHAERLPRSR